MVAPKTPPVEVKTVSKAQAESLFAAMFNGKVKDVKYVVAGKEKLTAPELKKKEIAIYDRLLAVFIADKKLVIK